MRLLVARTGGPWGAERYLPAARRCQRVFFSIFLCFFLRIRLRRFLMSDPMACATLVGADARRANQDPTTRRRESAAMRARRDQAADGASRRAVTATPRATRPRPARDARGAARTTRSPSTPGCSASPRSPSPPVLAARGGCWFEAGGVIVHLGVDAAFTPATKAHPAFVVDDLDELAATLAAAGVAVTYDDALEGVRRGYVADPFGNRIELIDATAR